ncbi:MAG: ABC transporter permease [Anaerolineae bacterium]|nr:ABC transporter permease [Anaerolineae bacterium]MDW8171992.1 ABC transporter permease [Anaerolineae bacterium]
MSLSLSRLFRRSTVFIFLLVLVVFFSLTTNRFLVGQNLTNILVQNSHVILTAVGMTLVMLSGGIDLSVGSVAALCGALSAGLVARNGLPAEIAIVLGLVAGFGLGLVNGGLVVYGKLPPFVATLSMLGVARGLTLAYTNSRPISNLGDAYNFWGRGDVLGVPMPLIVWVTVVVLMTYLLSQTRFGLYVYAIGGSEETARLASVPVNRVKMVTYGLSGTLAALAGVLLTARVYSAQPQAAVGLELQAITAAVLGGVSLFGGVGNIPTAVFGALLVGVLGNGMNHLRVASYPQQIIQGVVLVLAVAIDMATQRIGGHKSKRGSSS